jgi:hypothetical protein
MEEINFEVLDKIPKRVSRITRTFSPTKFPEQSEHHFIKENLDKYIETRASSIVNDKSITTHTSSIFNDQDVD